MSTWYVDPVGGNDSHSGNSFANRVKSINVLLAAAGDTIKIIGNNGPTSIGTATWTNGSANISLSSALTKTVSTCETAWTDPTGGHVTQGNSTSFYKEGSASVTVEPIPGFTGAANSKIAYLTLGSTLDLSGYQQIMLWASCSVTGSAPTLKFCLCSDSVGSTVLKSFTVTPGGSGHFAPNVFDFGSALPTNVNSIALYTTAAAAGYIGVTFYIDNIEACLASSNPASLTINSLIGKNNGTDTWYAIRSINGTTSAVVLDGIVSNNGSFLGFAGATEAVTTYKQETISNTAITQSINVSGTSASPILISGGWDTTSMSSQNGMTWIDGRGSSTQTGLSVNGSYISFDGNISFTRWQNGIINYGTSLQGSLGFNNCYYGLESVGNCYLTNITSAAACNAAIYSTGIYFNAVNIKNGHSNLSSALLSSSLSTVVSGMVYASNNGFYPISITNGGGRIGNIIASNNASPVNLSSSKTFRIDNATLTSNGGYGLYLNATASVTVSNLVTSGHTVAAIKVDGSTEVYHYLNTPTIVESTYVVFASATANQRVHAQNIGGTLNDNCVFFYGGTVVADTATPYVSGGIDYKVSITSTNRTSDYPIRIPIARIAYNGGSTVLFEMYVKKSHATNISADIKILAGQTIDFPTDIIVSATSTSYTQYTLSFIPTIQGVVEVVMDVYSNTGSTTDYIQYAYYKPYQV